MPIFPLPQFEADAEAARKADEEAYARLNAPKTMVVRFGSMRMIGEFPYDGDAKPGCGSKLVLRTHRGTEMGELLTSTCPNAGCGHAVTRRQMLEYIENSGGRDYPFFQDGRVLRVATAQDMNAQAALASEAGEMLRGARATAERLGLNDRMKVVEVELILGRERVTVHCASEERLDVRALTMELSAAFRGRVDVRQVGARDEARLAADYEKCGQHCCCKSFLKVLKPVPMKNAKLQKATLDPLKISGRCGRLMCCLRYEEATYDELRKNLPRKRTPVRTPDGPGVVIDTQILTQLVLVRLDATNEDAAYPLEALTPVQGGATAVAGAGEPDESDPADATDATDAADAGGPPPAKGGTAGHRRPQPGPGRAPTGGPDGRPDRGPDGRPDRSGGRPDDRRRGGGPGGPPPPPGRGGDRGPGRGPGPGAGPGPGSGPGPRP